MEYLCFIILLQVYYVSSNIRTSLLVNKLSKVRPVGANVGKRFLPLTELPPPHISHNKHDSGRRHLPDDCTKRTVKEVFEGPKVDIAGDYYDDRIGKTLATVIIPEHLDHKHFEITTQDPYFTVGAIDAIGYHPSTMKNEHPSECEKIYQDFLDDQYSAESADYSEESLEMARMPLFLQSFTENAAPSFEALYDDYR